MGTNLTHHHHETAMSDYVGWNVATGLIVFSVGCTAAMFWLAALLIALSTDDDDEDDDE